VSSRGYSERAAWPERAADQRREVAGGHRRPTRQAVSAVLDASVVLTLLFDEPGAESVAQVVANGATIRAVDITVSDCSMRSTV
jgi:hypothetical protein